MVRVWCQALATGTIREERRFGITAGTVFVRVSDMGKMITGFSQRRPGSSRSE